MWTDDGRSVVEPVVDIAAAGIATDAFLPNDVQQTKMLCCRWVCIFVVRKNVPAVRSAAWLDGSARFCFEERRVGWRRRHAIALCKRPTAHLARTKSSAAGAHTQRSGSNGVPPSGWYVGEPWGAYDRVHRARRAANEWRSLTPSSRCCCFRRAAAVLRTFDPQQSTWIVLPTRCWRWSHRPPEFTNARPSPTDQQEPDPYAPLHAWTVPRPYCSSTSPRLRLNDIKGVAY
jgi:hypothetical protein